MIAPVLDQIARDEADRLTIVSLDVDENPETTRRYNVLGMPTLILFAGGEVVSQTVGARPRAAILRELEPHLPARV
jgi:thioredoxin 1